MNATSLVISSLLLALPPRVRAQQADPIPADSARAIFAQARALCSADGGRLWGVSLCGPIMLVDAPSRRMVANRSDGRAVLTASHGVFVGSLPADQTVANTAMVWSGRTWTQMLWPLPADAHARATLVMHELYHRVQQLLPIPLFKERSEAHLDELEGRYYMQLEWRALARALGAGGDASRRAAARDALLFRGARYQRFVSARAEERALELNEGLAEYTGVVLGNPTAARRREMALHDLVSHASDATFVRSFAYATGPAYGLLLDRYAPGWRKHLSASEGLDGLLARALHASAPGDEATAAARAASYDGPALRAAESERDAKRREQMARDRATFVDGPVLTLVFRHMRVQFDPRDLRPLGDAGTIYPTIRVTDDWGAIEGRSGALMKPDWSALVVPAPATIGGRTITGDGWTLELRPDWMLVPGARAGDYVLASPR